MDLYQVEATGRMQFTMDRINPIQTNTEEKGILAGQEINSWHSTEEYIIF